MDCTDSDLNYNLISWLHGSADEFESTRIIGDRQFKKAVELFNTASEQLKGKVDFRHTYVDFSKLEVTISKQGGGTKVIKTCPAAMGFSFAAGTTDGPGSFDFKQGDVKVLLLDIYCVNHSCIRSAKSSIYMFYVSFYNSPPTVLSSGEGILEMVVLLT